MSGPCSDRATSLEFDHGLYPCPYFRIVSNFMFFLVESHDCDNKWLFHTRIFRFYRVPERTTDED